MGGGGNGGIREKRITCWFKWLVAVCWPTDLSVLCVAGCYHSSSLGPQIWQAPSFSFTWPPTSALAVSCWMMRMMLWRMEIYLMLTTTPLTVSTSWQGVPGAPWRRGVRIRRWIWVLCSSFIWLWRGRCTCRLSECLAGEDWEMVIETGLRSGFM